MMNNNKKFWQNSAKFYSFFINHSKAYQNNFKKIMKIFSPYINKNMEVLEIGCGTGQISFLITKKVKRLIATDFSQQMIKICKAKNDTNIIFQIEDATNLSFDDNSFDCVLISNVLHIVPNPEKIIAEIKRVVKDGGIILAPIYVSEHNKKDITSVFLEKIGLKTYKNTTKKEYIHFLKKAGLKILLARTIKAYPMKEFVVICKK